MKRLKTESTTRECLLHRFQDNVFLIVLKVVVFITALLFVTNFKFKKPNNLMLSVLVFVVAMAVIYMFTTHWLMWRMS